MALAEIFGETMPHLFSGNPLENLDDYRCFTESSFLVDVQRWPYSSDPNLKRLGEQCEGVVQASCIRIHQDNGAETLVQLCTLTSIHQDH